ncbi:alpha/beta fold hydrolase [Sulfitobacter mediterraneus]|uniref:alpha/beta fold hydrolase n=1 Tax=Sulfitobacter mediterraneus TaxID=83219 RepID=UPI000EA03395|nr:alpha/beta hydrolase [Sulfitobacter mediterraneus]
MRYTNPRHLRWTKLAGKLALLLILLAGIVALTQWRASVQERGAVAAHPPTGEIVDVNGVPVHYQIMGTGPDLVMIHGASGNLRDFTLSFAARLSDRYRVILFDRPGLGWTGRLPVAKGAWNARAESPQEQAALLQGAADQIGVTSPIVLGHSFGGAVSLAWGLSRPDETAALVLVSAVSEPWPGDLGWTYKVTGSSLGGGLAVPLITAFVPEPYIASSIESIFAPQSPPAGYASHLGVDLSLRRSTLRANAQQVMSLRPHVVEMQKEYHNLTMPIEIIHGDADTIVPAVVHAEVLIGDVPQGNLTILPGEGHMPQHTQPEAVIAAIDRAAASAGLR